MSGKRRRGPTPRRRWQPLQRATVRPDLYRKHGLSAPDAAFRNDLYSVCVREIGGGAMHISFHRHDRAPARDWRHYQAIKNEVAGPERAAVEIFPPESLLVDTSNEYHLFVWPEDLPLPFLWKNEHGAPLLMDSRDLIETMGETKARQRDWEPGIPTGKGRSE